MALAALAVGAAAGWFAAGAWGERKCGNVELCNCGNVETANVGRARSPVSPERSEPRKRWLQGCAPNEKANPLRKAPIRSTADAEVQRRILKANVAALEKRLVAAKKEAERIAAARAAQGSSGALDEAALLMQRSEALKKLGKKLDEATVGELREHAPDWWARELQKEMRWCDRHRTRTVRMENVLSSADMESMTEDEREVHLRLMERLAETSSFYDGLLDAVNDDTTYAEFNKITRTVFEERKRDLELAQKERKTLHDKMSRMYNLSGEDAGALDAVCKKTARTVKNCGVSNFFASADDNDGALNDGKGATK